MPTTNPQSPTHEQITERARRYYEEAGSPEGRDEEFWLRAEQDLQNESNGEQAAAKQSQTNNSKASGAQRKR